MASEKSNNKLVKQNLSENLCNLSCLKLSRVPVEAIKRNRRITILDLHRNYLTRLGEDFATLHNIKKLNLNHNALTSLPHNFGNLINLTSLSLYNNNLLDLPASMGNLKNLRFLDLRDNAFKYELEVIIGTCESVEECEKCAVSVVQYFHNKFYRFNNMSTLKDSNQAETDDNCSEVSISNMSINSDTEDDEDVGAFEEVKKASILYIRTKYRNQKECETNIVRNSKDADSDGSMEYVTESDDDSFKDVSSSETESKKSLQETSHEVIAEKGNDYVQNEGLCGNQNIVQCVTSGEQEKGELKVQTPVKMIETYWFKVFVKYFLHVLFAAFIFAAIYFICTLSLDFYPNKLSNFTEKYFNWSSPKLVCEENERDSVESQTQEVYEEEQHSTTKTFVDKIILDNEETPMPTWFEKILYVFIILSKLCKINGRFLAWFRYVLLSLVLNARKCKCQTRNLTINAFAISVAADTL
ncbi:leucine-rich repeat-containing protein 59-like [Teleopsis dalmanni]|uniref:leucine-rich repeat-containing protein 59-like n=1 Tax=Teleopsis dalmanni TaxID=139649 RepID=UPI0018CF9EF3|nr:leucine-rich repeat-containing protein 59-like [Teleopsis dalmanni]